MTFRDREEFTLQCANCGYRVHQVGLTWVHPDMTSTCRRSGSVMPVHVWLEPGVGEPF